MASCETCRWRRGFALHPIENSPAIPIGWCRHDTPKLVAAEQGGWPPVKLAAWCRQYRFSLRAWWRKGKETQ